jgi:hypothetical protein
VRDAGQLGGDVIPNGRRDLEVMSRQVQVHACLRGFTGIFSD